VVTPANFNSPGQVVVSGETRALETVAALAREKGAKRVIPLPVSGPFHSPLMKEAGEQFALFLNEFSFSPPRVAFVSNVTGGYASAPSDIKRLLVEQLTAPVLWEDVVRRLFQDGCQTFVEVGPGKVLSGLIKRTLSGVQVFQTSDPCSLEKVLALLGRSV
jgi:[acyl-carrier-protein] S-malonyltransferase